MNIPGLVIQMEAWSREELAARPLAFGREYVVVALVQVHVRAALIVPASRRIASICSPIASSVVRSGPAILIPTGVLMPVESMSIRVLMGIVQALVSPGN